MSVEVTIDRGLKELGVYLYYAYVPSVKVTPTPRALDEELSRAEEEVKASIGTPEGLSEHPVVKAYRSMLWRLGVDPTKTRPSGEALARRVLHGKRIPRINSVVDSGNLVSLKTLVPIGLYDAPRIRGSLRLTRASGVEEFRPIGGRPTTVKKGTPIMVDGEGRVIHVYPHRDSELTMITESTSALLAIAAGAPGVPRSLVRKSLEDLLGLLAKYSSALVAGVEVKEA